MGSHGVSGMGMRKHGKSGWKNGPGKSPKLRHAEKREAEAENRKARKSTTQWRGSIKDLMSRR